MKNIAFAFITLIVGSLASPNIPSLYSTASAQEVTRNERIVTGQIIEMIENISQQIRDAGLDPMERTLDAAYELPVPVLFSAKVIVDNFKFLGLSNIVVQSMNFSLLQSRLTFNIVLPGLAVSIDKANGEAIFFGKEYTGNVSGRLAINTIRIIGDVRVNVGIISGISVRSLSLQFSLGGIASNLNIKLFDKDLSSKINTFLGTTVPGTINQFGPEINQLLEIVALSVINDALENRSLF